MDFFEMMDKVRVARLRGKRAWKRVRRWLQTHPRYPSLPGGTEVAHEVAKYLDHQHRWNKK